MRKTPTVGVFVLVAATWGLAQEPATQPTSRPPPTSQERINDLVVLIEGQSTTPEVRRTIARELLLQQWSETPARVAALLAGQNTAAKVAVAGALADLPQYLETVYVEPLVEMLADKDADARTAAARALARFRNGGVIPRLRNQVLDAEQPVPARLGAIAALGMMTQREAIDGLAEALRDPDAVLATAALGALQQATAMDFGDDVAAARKWWEGTRGLPLEAWQQLQIERLVQKDRDSRARLDALEDRLVKALEANFKKAPDAERLQLLASYLADTIPVFRLLGLRMTQLHLDEGKPVDSLAPELMARIRDLMSSTDPREQAAAVRTVARFRKSQDGERFVAMLPGAKNRLVRLALINGLGYVGEGGAAELVLNQREGADDETATEIVAAIGRLAEREVLSSEERENVVRALAEVFGRTQPTQVALRERVLWAMGNVADPSFGPAFAAALGLGEAVAVRQQAVRGIAVLDDARWADALAGAAGDTDAVVRKTAAETLGALGTTDRHLQALWARLTSPPETEETIRQVAWRSALKILEKRTPADVEDWIGRLPGDARARAQRTLDLLHRLLRLAETASPPEKARVGALRARIAAQYVQIEQHAEAIAEYGKALGELRGAGSEVEQRVAQELLRCALVGGRYDQAVADTLAGANPGPDGQSLWAAARSEVELRLTPSGAGQAQAMLEALERYPPGKWPDAALAELRTLSEQARQLQRAADNSRPETEPSSKPVHPRGNAARE